MGPGGCSHLNVGAEKVLIKLWRLQPYQCRQREGPNRIVAAAANSMSAKRRFK